MTKDEQWLLNEKYGGVTSVAYETDKARLTEGEPVAYVIGSIPFLGLTIYLDSRPLIPRPETEWWSEQMLASLSEENGNVMKNSLACMRSGDRRPEDFLKDVPVLRVLDVCAGSGAIGCAVLAKIPNAHVAFGEIDPAHKATIEKNIRENHLDASRADIRTGDLFVPFGDMQFDIIAVNPPYIPSGRMLDDSVTRFEPHQALFSGTDGLKLISRFARELPAHLNPSGTAWIECDSSNVASAEELFMKQGFSTKIRTDQYGVPRILVVSFPL